MSSPQRGGDLTFVELLRFGWRQLTSMRTALVLLLLLALASIPGSIIPQSGVDSLKTSNWQEAHPKLTPIYEKLQLFSVYDSAWFSAIYLLLMISLVGCILPRLKVYWRGARAQPPVAPRNLSRLPDHTSYDASDGAADLARSVDVLRKRRYRVRSELDEGWVSAEKGYLREAGNLLFHLSIVLVLIGFAMGGLFGYKGGVIVLVGNGFANNLTQYDDFDPGQLFNPDSMEPFSFTIDDFEAHWLTDGPKAGMALDFASHLSYQAEPGAPERDYELKVNHPLTIGSTEIFLVGHGYAPSFTITDRTGKVAFKGPVTFLPVDPLNFTSFGVVKAPDATPQIGLEGEFYPSYYFTHETGPMSIFGDALDPKVSLLAYTGDLGLDNGTPQSVYVLPKANLKQLTKPDGSMFRVDLGPGESVKLPDGAGTVSFDGWQRWNRVQISRTPGKELALIGVSLALVGLLGSLFIRPRRIWVRRLDDGTIEVAGLDRSGGGDTAAEVEAVVVLLRREETP